jgi:hypothetical protein
MSEYQYYEFIAIDKPLTSQQMAEMREVSTRANITATSFVNEYNYGDFKGEPKQWIEEYFDTFVYTANWCSCQFMLRVPLDCLSVKTVQAFQFEPLDSFEITQTATHWILHWQLFESENYDRFGGEYGGGGWMGRLAPLRDELLRGDLRSLYLGWLSGIYEFNDDTLEPPIPAGLGELTAAQTALVEFLEIDVDFVSAAAMASLPLVDNRSNADYKIWLDSFSIEQSKSFLHLLLEGRGQEAERKLKSEFFTWQREQSNNPKAVPKPRKVSELRKLAETAEKEREEREAIAEKERKEREAIAAKKAAIEKERKREVHLRMMLTNTQAHWANADSHAQRANASGYDEATRIIKDLADAYKLAGDMSDFKEPFTKFVNAHEKRRALMDRLKKEKLL